MTIARLDAALRRRAEGQMERLVRDLKKGTSDLRGRFMRGCSAHGGAGRHGNQMLDLIVGEVSRDGDLQAEQIRQRDEWQERMIHLIHEKLAAEHLADIERIKKVQADQGEDIERLVGMVGE